MEWRGVTITNVYIGNFFFAAGLLLKSNGLLNVFSSWNRHWHGHLSSMGNYPW